MKDFICNPANHRDEMVVGKFIISIKKFGKEYELIILEGNEPIYPRNDDRFNCESVAKFFDDKYTAYLPAEEIEDILEIIDKSCRDFCGCCEEEIEDFESFGFYGDEGTDYASKMVCESCYDEGDPNVTVYYRNSDEPQYITSTRNTTEGDFINEWHSTDGWRGWYELKSTTYKQLFSDVILSGHSSEEMLHKLYERVNEEFEKSNIDFVRAFIRTSNVFSTHLEYWIRNDISEWFKASIILEKFKSEVDYDNTEYSTGIIMGRDELKNLGTALGKTFKTDNELMNYVKDNDTDKILETLSKNS